MGLEEKRELWLFEKSIFPPLQKQVEEAAGGPLRWSIDWQTLGKEGHAEDCQEALLSNFFFPLLEALRSLRQESPGKGACAIGLSAIRITSQRKWCSLLVQWDGGELQLDADPSYCRDKSCVPDYTQRILEVLERPLELGGDE